MAAWGQATLTFAFPSFFGALRVEVDGRQGFFRLSFGKSQKKTRVAFPTGHPGVCSFYFQKDLTLQEFVDDGFQHLLSSALVRSRIAFL